MNHDQVLDYCPECGQRLPVFDSVSIKYCPHCGINLMSPNQEIKPVEDTHHEESISHSFTSYTRVDINQARIVESENSLKRLVIEKLAESGQLFFKTICILVTVLIVSVGGYFFISYVSAHSPITVPAKADNYIDQSAYLVKQELQDAGFTNIKMNPVDDNTLYDVNMPLTGWRLYSVTVDPGNVIKISIAGETDFQKGDHFDREARVVITFYQE